MSQFDDERGFHGTPCPKCGHHNCPQGRGCARRVERQKYQSRIATLEAQVKSLEKYAVLADLLESRNKSPGPWSVSSADKFIEILNNGLHVRYYPRGTETLEHKGRRWHLLAGDTINIHLHHEVSITKDDE